VIVQQTTGQGVGGGQSHSDYECDSWYMHVPGLKTVVPTTAYDAKGLIIAGIRSDDPVMYIMGGALRSVRDDVPDEAYEVPIGKAVVRQEGKDITIVTSGHGVLACIPAVKKLNKEMSVEYIDLRTLKPLDRKTLVESVRKTGRLLTVDQSYYTLCPGAEVIATCAEGVPSAKFKRLAFPDVSPGGAPEIINYQKVNAEQVVRAAQMLLKV
jgi:pyruvate dehydrogenase E1 component beta subunit